MTVPQSVVDARRQALTSDYFALGYLALCAASYSDESGVPSAIEQAIETNVPSMTALTHWSTPGYWQLEWGPAITQQRLSWKANLLFAASYREQSSKLPVFTAVCIRGTDTTAGVRGVLTQLREDLGAHCQRQWGTPVEDASTFALFGCASGSESQSSTPYVAAGTLLGLDDLLGLTGKNQTTGDQQTVEQFLTSFVPQYASADAPLPVVVTGHSLGGCQTSVVAMALQGLPLFGDGGAVIAPNSFAAPTAGNQAFADLYLKTFPHARRWYNTFDLIPFAFDALPGMQELWSGGVYAACSDPIPSDAKFLLALIERDIRGLQYVHENGTATRSMAGSCMPAGQSRHPWVGQLEYQHFLPCGYWANMLKNYKSVLGPMDRPTWNDKVPPVCG